MKNFSMYFMRFMERLAEQSLLLAIRRGLALVLPLIMAGAVALMVLHLPVPAWQRMWDGLLGDSWRELGHLIQQGSFGIASLAMLVSIASAYARQKRASSAQRGVNPGVTVAVCLSCYFVVAAPLHGGIPLGFFSMGGGGFPIALFVAVGVPPLFWFLATRVRLHRSLYTVGSDPEVIDALAAIPAGVALILAAGMLRLLLEYAGLHDLRMQAQALFGLAFKGADNSLGTGLGYVAMSQVLWFFGGHGPNLLFEVERELLAAASAANIQAVAQGGIPHLILTKPFLDAFVHLGGSGSTLALILALLLRAREANTRLLALLALAPALCNVNEVILFGLPLVLNPVYALPFLLAPLLQTAIAHGATALGWVPVTVGSMHWTTPILFGGYAATGSPAGSALQVINLGVGILAYLPFVGLANGIHARRWQRAMDGLLTVAAHATTVPGRKKCLDLPGQEGLLAKTLAIDLARALRRGGQLFLEFQPQVDASQGRVVGCEALLRWRHPQHGMIAPNLAVALAEDSGLIHKLGHWVLAEACRQHAALLAQGVSQAVLSVNFSALQFDNPALVEQVLEVLQETGLPPAKLQMEVTESIALTPDAASVGILQRLQALGVGVAIDDFGMGHTSLRYLKEFPVNTVKIDRSLTQESARGVNDHIISSIVSLCEALGIEIIVEGVETEEQLRRFQGHRCSVFQGYLFSRPLGVHALRAYLKERARAA